MKEEWGQMKNIKRFIKWLIIIALVIYSLVTFINQQKILNTYATNKEEVESNLQEAKKEQEELGKIKENINSKEYIEDAAREELDMYLPNERVYVDQQN